MENDDYGQNELFAELFLEKWPETEEEEVDAGGPYEPTEEEAEEVFATLSQVLKEKEEKKAEELSKWLAEWKVLTDEAEEMLKALGYKDEIVHVESFEEIMSGAVIIGLGG